jgi:hypothetical protein
VVVVVRLFQAAGTVSLAVRAAVPVMPVPPLWRVSWAALAPAGKAAMVGALLRKLRQMTGAAAVVVVRAQPAVLGLHLPALALLEATVWRTRSRARRLPTLAVAAVLASGLGSRGRRVALGVAVPVGRHLRQLAFLAPTGSAAAVAVVVVRAQTAQAATAATAL